jgi:hypothetical protein
VVIRDRACLAVVATLAAVLGACADPVHEDLVESLGPEAAGVPPGPLHRPGQPCLACHGGLGPASLQFSAGGTIYAVRGAPAPAVGAMVQIEDIEGNYWTSTTNSAGNFFVELAHFAPIYPIRMEVVSSDSSLVQRMQTYAARPDSCADCHASQVNARSAGPVYLAVVIDGGAP